MPLIVQALVDAVGILLLVLAVILAAGGRRGAHSGPVKFHAGPYIGQHVPGAPPVQGPVPPYVARYVERTGEHRLVTA